MREQCIVGLLSMAMGVAACALLDKYEYDRIDYLAGRMRDIGAEGIDDDILFLDGDKVPMGDIVAEIELLKGLYDCICYGIDGSLEHSGLRSFMREDGKHGIVEWQARGFPYAYGCYSCGLRVSREAVRRLRDLNGGGSSIPPSTGYGATRTTSSPTNSDTRASASAIRHGSVCRVRSAVATTNENSMGSRTTSSSASDCGATFSARPYNGRDENRKPVSIGHRFFIFCSTLCRNALAQPRHNLLYLQCDRCRLLQTISYRGTIWTRLSSRYSKLQKKSVCPPKGGVPTTSGPPRNPSGTSRNISNGRNTRSAVPKSKKN